MLTKLYFLLRVLKFYSKQFFHFINIKQLFNDVNYISFSGVNNQLNGIPEEQNVSDEPTEATSMV